MKTFFLKQKQISKSWVLIDASDAVVGRLAAFASTLLRGKNKVIYTPHMDCGDNVIIINASKAKFTGTKTKDKIYYRHTGHPGGIKSTTPQKIFASKYPERVIQLAIRRMMGSGPMSRKRLGNLYVYPGATHKHNAQKPKPINFISFNKKNVRR